MTSFNGSVFNGLHPVALPARLDMTTQSATLTTDTLTATFPLGELTITPRVGSAERLISFPNGRQFACADHESLDTLPQESPSEGTVAWLEARWGVAVGCVATIAVLLVMGYFLGLPMAAERIAQHIPMDTELTLGEHVVALIEENGWMTPSALDAEKTEKIETQFYRITSDLPLKEYYRLEFRTGNVFGANALAFPGGVIIITDEMIENAETLDEIIAVLAHEIGHVEMRHAMRGILQNSVLAAAVATVTADAATLSAAVTGLPLMFAQTKYSRDFERDADQFAFELLKTHGFSPDAFATIMERLANQDKEDQGFFQYLSSHPVTEDRVQQARNAAE